MPPPQLLKGSDLMTDLQDGQFSLDDYVFGLPTDPVTILQGGFDTGAPESRTQDADMPGGDGSLFGRDYLSGPTWGFTLGVKDDDDVYEVLSDLARVWRNPAVRTTPGVMSTLRFKRRGKTYRVYGRPRRFGVAPSPTEDYEFQIVEADFKIESPVMYTDEATTSVLSLGEEFETTHVILPETLEWVLGQQTAGNTVVLNVQTLDPAPFEIRITGPNSGALSNWKVEGPGWEIASTEVVSAGQTVLIDTRSMTITKNGVSVAGTLTRASRLNARLYAGLSQVTFSGTDATFTAQAHVSYRPAHPIL
jgi:hypothetical protein